MITSSNKIEEVKEYNRFLEVWPFLLEGLQVVQAETAGNMPDITSQAFFKFLMLLALEENKGCILMLKSKNDKPLGYIALADNTQLFQPKCINIYCLYSNNKCPSTTEELSRAARSWAKKNGFVKAQACSYRINGAAKRFFEKKLGFRQRFLVFEATI